MAVGRSDAALDVRILFHQSGIVGGILSQQILQRDQHAFLAVTDDFRAGQGGGHQHVGIFAAGKHQSLGFAIALRGNLLEVQLDAADFLILVEEIHGRPIGVDRTLLAIDGQGEFLVNDGQFAFSVQDGSVRQRVYGQKHQSQNDAKQLLHKVHLLLRFDGFG